MAFTCGFFNSLSGDRKYYAEQMSAIFDGIIMDGVFQSIGNKLFAIPGNGMQVVVQSGKAWFDHTWNVNDSNLALELDPADISQTRVDAVVLEVDHTNAVRNNKIYILKGSLGGDKPSMETGNNKITRHPLAYVTVEAGIESIKTSNIEIIVGKEECPFVTSVLEAADISTLWQGWTEQFEAKVEEWNAEFDEWFSHIETALEGNVAASLQKQIDDLKSDVETNRIKVYTGVNAPNSETGRNFDFYVKTK